MSTLIRNIVLTAAGIGVIVSVVFYVTQSTATRIAYIDNVRLFDEFILKEELSRDLSKKEAIWKSQLDSMRIQINLLGRKIESEKAGKEAVEQFEFIRQQYLVKEEQYKADNEKTAAQFNQQIWKQLNNYVKEFAKNYNYDVVLGTSGEGNLMYASEEYDVTTLAVDFVNQRYKGKS